MSVFLHGLALENYRGIGPRPQRMAPFKQFNIFIGANNSGKSSVLNFISKFLPLPQHGDRGPALDYLEQYSGGTKGPVRVSIGFEADEALKALIDSTGNWQSQESLKKIFPFLKLQGLVWKRGEIPLQKLTPEVPDEKNFRNCLDQYSWRDLWSDLTSQSGGGFDAHWYPETVSRIFASLKTELPETKIIPAIREIGTAAENFSDYSGVGLIPKLAELQSPDHDKRSERLLFDKINKFLGVVTGRPEAQLEIPHNRQHILVHMDGKILPLASLGTGIQEVIMIASFCTISENEIVCIEEPELHLHPLLQRQLLEYLRTNTSNQYFIATHSPSFIDQLGAAIFHVRLENEQTVVEEAVLRKQRYAICNDLGHRASDLVQSNSVIWVEGPSDRVYLKHWISSMAPELTEGIHYSIMFYGGRLLSHLSASDEEVKEFIDLKALNRNMAVLIDSDKRKARDKINLTKQRVVDELGPTDAWITKGREIENYIPHAILQGAVQKIHAGTYKAAAAGGQYDNALLFKRITGSKLEANVDKVKVAKEVCTLVPDFDVLDLRKRVSTLVRMIKTANGL